VVVGFVLLLLLLPPLPPVLVRAARPATAFRGGMVVACGG